MTKSEQQAINKQVMDALTDLGFTIRTHCPKENMAHWTKLRSCSASVAAIGNYYVLRSYDTTIACIDTRTDTLYDFLRYVYGYTATSAQHISKFDKDYGSGKWGCTHRLTYKEV